MDGTLQRTWENIRLSEAKMSRVNIEPLWFLNFKNDTSTSLPQLEEFLDTLSKRQGKTIKVPFSPCYPLPEIESIVDWCAQCSNGARQAAWYGRQLSSLSEWLDPKLQHVREILQQRVKHSGTLYRRTKPKSG